MTDSSSSFAAFRKDLETIGRDLDRFAEFYEDVHYVYYHAKSPVPQDVWRYLADEYLRTHEISPDGTACVSWDEHTFDVTKFKLLCQQCCKLLSKHADLLATVAEISGPAGMPWGHHQWIRMIHEIAGSNPVWSGLINKFLVVSERPYEETKKEREIEWAREEPVPDGINATREPDEPYEPEERLIHKLHAQGVSSVPDVWFEYIPGKVVQFHRHVLDVLAELVQVGNVHQESPHAEPATQQPVPPKKAEPSDVEIPVLVTLRQVAPLVGLSKATLRHYKDSMPPPIGSWENGKTYRWDWKELRPWLEETFDIRLPERFPDPTPPRSS